MLDSEIELNPEFLQYSFSYNHENNSQGRSVATLIPIFPLKGVQYVFELLQLNI